MHAYVVQILWHCIQLAVGSLDMPWKANNEHGRPGRALLAVNLNARALPTYTQHRLLDPISFHEAIAFEVSDERSV